VLLYCLLHQHLGRGTCSIITGWVRTAGTGHRQDENRKYSESRVQVQVRTKTAHHTQSLQVGLRAPVLPSSASSPLAWGVARPSPHLRPFSGEYLLARLGHLCYSSYNVEKLAQRLAMVPVALALYSPLAAGVLGGGGGRPAGNSCGLRA